ncbi:hypothetical protein [Puia dinghuensis]|uniref:O-antigen ligase domain-containing protein n=1 Tax=Puia dinghuensis TaxID=1792502 RepID=A0A8J2XS49_9BACT|nr:hypothetical protein [Puia dinghuensis]GGB06357.1 hypothetical protein GCM10011511_32210 [Puia dinghuensis]
MRASSLSIKNIFRLETLIVLYFLALLFFGKGFTKFPVIGPLYLHDAVLLLITLLAINRGKLVSRFNSIWLLLAIAVFYLVVSLLFFHLPGPIVLMAFRQFNLFLYLGCTFVTFNAVVMTSSDLWKPIALIKLISVLSVVLQCGLLIYGKLFVPNFELFGEGDYNYYSPLAVFGIITYGAMVATYEKNVYLRWIKLILVLFLSTTTGHSSAFLAVFVIILVHLFIMIKPMQRFIALGFCLGAVLVLDFLPEFRDVNASWRLLYWNHVLHNVIVDHYMILGNGFGRPFMTYDFALYLNDALHSPIMIDELYPMARYLSPPHNSLLTMCFHVGLLPVLLLLIPLRRFFVQVLMRSRPADDSVTFLVYALPGCFVWVMFNVILELPHSATFFWLVFLTTAYALKVQDKRATT